MPEDTMQRGEAQEQVLLALMKLALYHTAMVEALQEELGAG